MSYEYFLKINTLIYNLLCFPQGVYFTRLQLKELINFV